MNGADPRGRLLSLADARAVSLAELSRLIGRNGTYLQQFVRKGSPRKLEEGDRRVLARFFGIDEVELGASAGDFTTAGEWSDIPRLALGASAGPGAVPADERPFGAFRFSTRWLRGQGYDPAALSAIMVTGDSMEATLRDGDEILVDRTPGPLRDGVHVVRVDDMLLVKRIDAARAGAIRLLSDNPAYDPIEVAPAALSIVGRVVWKAGRL